MHTARANQHRYLQPSEALNKGLETDLLAEADPAELEQESRLLQAHAVLVGNIGLILPRDEVSEIVERLTACRLPNTAPWFNGVTSVRGSMIPVFDLHELFSIDHENIRRRLVVVGEAETAASFWVDGFPQMVLLSDQEIMATTPPIPPLIREHAKRFYLKDGQIWVDWDIKSFFMTLGDQL
jgi:chemotaxis signal transduction protein